MELVFSIKADEDFYRLPEESKSLFHKHLNKMLLMPPRRHMKHGINCCVENVGGQGRIVYQVKEEKILILRFFADHKDYEKWFRSYR